MQVIGHMMNRCMARAFDAWWGAVLEKREVLDRIEGILARMRNQELSQVGTTII